MTKDLSANNGSYIYMATHTLAEVSTGHLGETVEVLGNPTGNQKTPRRGWPPKTSANGFPWNYSANHSLKYHGIPRRKTQWMHLQDFILIKIGLHILR